MKIDAQKGTKVVFMYPNNGYSHDQEIARKHLEKGKEYTVAQVDVGRYETDVYLKEVPGIVFNSVMFE